MKTYPTKAHVLQHMLRLYNNACFLKKVITLFWLLLLQKGLHFKGKNILFEYFYLEQQTMEGDL